MTIFFDPVPYVPVDITINLTNQEYAPLRFDKGHVAILEVQEALSFTAKVSIVIRLLKGTAPTGAMRSVLL